MQDFVTSHHPMICILFSCVNGLSHKVNVNNKVVISIEGLAVLVMLRPKKCSH